MTKEMKIQELFSHCRLYIKDGCNHSNITQWILSVVADCLKSVNSIALYGYRLLTNLASVSTSTEDCILKMDIPTMTSPVGFLKGPVSAFWLSKARSNNVEAEMVHQ